MNNWRLLLLAIVAVFHPVTSFTDRKLIDGRQQRCDYLSAAPLRDLYGTQSSKTLHAERRINYQDEDRRHELSQRDSLFDRPSTGRSSVNIRDRVLNQRLTDVDFRLERLRKSQSRERLLEVNRREKSARYARDFKPLNLLRRVVDRTSSDAVERRNDRSYTEPSRYLFENDYRSNGLDDERLSKRSFDSQRQMQREQFRHEDRRVSLNSDTQRAHIREGKVVRNMDRQRITRGRLVVVRRETSMPCDTRRCVDLNGETRDELRNREQRSLQENTRLVDQIRNMRIRLNVHDDNQGNRQRTGAHQRVSADTSRARALTEGRRETKQHNKENDHSRTSSERTQLIRRFTRESRIIIEKNTLNNGEANSVPVKKHERLSREQNKRGNTEQKLSREIRDYRNIRESRIMNTQLTRNIDSRREVIPNERMTREYRNEVRDQLDKRVTRERIHLDRGNSREYINSQNRRDVDVRQETRQYNENMFSQTVNNKIDRSNQRESRISRTQYDMEVQREINKGRISRENRDDIRYNQEQRYTRERNLSDRRDTRESRNTDTLNVRNTHNLQETRYTEKMSRNARDDRDNHFSRRYLGMTQTDRRNFRENKNIDSTFRENRDDTRINSNLRFALQRIQMERRHIRDMGTINTSKDKNVDRRREIRYVEARSADITEEIKSNSQQIVSREIFQVNRRNIREFRKNNNDIRLQKVVESSIENIKDSRIRTRNIATAGQLQMERRNTHESRTLNTPHHFDSRPETRPVVSNERLSGKTREEIRENAGRRLARESTEIDRRNMREARTTRRVAVRDERDIENNIESQREISYYQRFSQHVRGNERRMQTRSANRVIAVERDGVVMDRRSHSAYRLNFPEIRVEPRLSPSAITERRIEVFGHRVGNKNKNEHREREANDDRFQNVELARNSERIHSVRVIKTETVNETTGAGWQFALYTLQAAYLCALFLQMVTPNHIEKPNKMTPHWLTITSRYNPIKVD